MSKELEGFSLVLRRWLPALFWMALVAIFSLDWASYTRTYFVTKPFLLWIQPGLSENTVYEITMAVRKSMHVAEFAIMAILLWAVHRRKFPISRASDPRGMGFALGICLLFALGTEGAQFFFASRIPSLRDVMFDMLGAALGLAIACGLRARRLRRESAPSAAPAIIPSIPRHVRALLTADLHLDPGNPEADPVLGQLRETLLHTRPDVCVVAGDIGPAENAPACLSALRDAAGGVPVVICLGNQDHWVPRADWGRFPDLETVRRSLWLPAAEQTGVQCLDFGNAPFDNLVITGGYGHYDLGMRPAHLSINGSKEATFSDYLAGKYAGLGWNDMLHLPQAASQIETEARLQAAGIRTRLADAAASGKRLLLVTHTVPFPALIGHHARPGSPANFFDAYAGNSLLSGLLGDFADDIDLAVCGHTHHRVPPRDILGITCANIGRDREALRFLMYDSASNTVRELPPLLAAAH